MAGMPGSGHGGQPGGGEAAKGLCYWVGHRSVQGGQADMRRGLFQLAAKGDLTQSDRPLHPAAIPGPLCRDVPEPLGQGRGQRQALGLGLGSLRSVPAIDQGHQRARGGNIGRVQRQRLP